MPSVPFVQSASIRRARTAGIAGLVGFAVGIPTLVAVSDTSAAATASTIRMNVSTEPVKDSAGRTWEARYGFDTGNPSLSYWGSYDIKGTTDDALYRGEMVRMNSWSAPVVNGSYDVTLKMREAWWNQPGQRVFDVSAEGQRKLTGVDIIAAVGKDTAYDRTFRVDVRDGRLDLGFSASKDSALVSAIQVVPAGGAAPQAPAPTGSVVTRMSMYPYAVKDSAGNTYAARSGFTGGDLVDLIPASTDIAGTNDDVLYRPEFIRFGSWSHPLAAGTYDVTLKMREGFWDKAGQRVFDVVAEGATRLSGVDIYAAVGKNTAYDRTFRVDVRDGRLDMSTVNRVDLAAISAIVVSKADGAPAPTQPPAPTQTPQPTPTPTPTQTPAPTTAPKPPVSATTSRPSGLIFDSGLFPMHKASIATEFERQRGRKADVLTVFPSRESWGAMQGLWFMDGQRIPADFKGTLDVGVPLWPNDGNLNTAASGGYNGQWEQLARNIAAKYPDAYIRLGWEMNLPGWKHAAYPDTAEQWKQAYRHAVNAIRKGGPKLRIAWVVNEGPGQTGTLDARIFYPGDAYVDFIGMDAYDWWPGYTSQANIAKHRDSAYGWNFWLDFAKSRGKKFVLPEWGVAPANSASGGDNPMYISFVYDWMKKNAAWIGYESYFQESASYIRSDLFTNSPRASAEYKRWMPLLDAK